jgi:hypothetical protein
MLLLLTVADMVAHREIKLDALYRCMAISVLIMTASALAASLLGLTEGKYGVGDTHGYFTPHSLAISLSIGLIVPLTLATRQQKRLFRWALLAFSAVIVVCIAKTYVRTGWTACIATVFALNVLFWRYGKGDSVGSTSSPQGWKTLIWAQAILAGVIVVYTLINLEALIMRNRDFMGEGPVSAGSGRIEIYSAMLNRYANFSMLQKVFGGGYAATLLMTVNRGFSPHNDYLNILVAGGLVGLSLYLWITVSLWNQIKRESHLWSSGLPLIVAGSAIAAYLVASMTNGIWDYVAVMTYFSFLVGGAIGYYQQNQGLGSRKL